MEGDPSIPVIVDTWMKGLRDFDVDLAYEAMYKSATLPGAKNLMRPDNDDYMSKGYVPLREQYDNSVSHVISIIIAKSSVLSVRFFLTALFTVRLIPDKERILNRIPVSMKVVHGIIHSMCHMMFMDLPS